MDALAAAEAEAQLAVAGEHLQHPDITKYPEHAMLQQRLVDGQTRLLGVKKELDRLALEKEVATHREVLAASATRLENALDAARRTEAGEAELTELRGAREELVDKLSAGPGLEARDAPLSTYAAGLRKIVQKAGDDARRTERLVAFRAGPVASHLLATELSEQVKLEPDPAKQRERRAEVLDHLKTCAAKARMMLEQSPELAKEKQDVGGKLTPLASVGPSCEKRASALEKLLKKPAKEKVAAAGGKKKAAKKRRIDLDL